MKNFTLQPLIHVLKIILILFSDILELFNIGNWEYYEDFIIITDRYGNSTGEKIKFQARKNKWTKNKFLYTQRPIISGHGFVYNDNTWQRYDEFTKLTQY